MNNVNINLEMHEVLRTINFGRNTDAAIEFVKMLTAAEIPNVRIEEVLAAISALGSAIIELNVNQQFTNQLLGELMARIDEQAAQLSAQLDANTAQAQKAFGEIRAALDKALESQITQEELDAAVEAARTAAREEANQANEAAVDAAFAPLQEKVAAQKSAMQTLDDIVPDAPTEPTPEEPVPPAE